MKKVIGIIFIAIMMFSLVGCKDSSDDNKNHIHSFEEWETTKNPTCTDEGTKVRYCSCGEIQSQNIPALGHTEVIDNAVEPSCEKTGLTQGKHCSTCGEILIEQNIIDALGHEWGNPTCTTIRSCCICFEEDPNGKPLGHSYVGGECTVCGAEDPDYNLTLTADKYNLSLITTSATVLITMIGGDTVSYDIDNSDIVYCQWGEWKGDIIPLVIYPINSGKTVVTVYIKNTNKKIQINVEVIEHSHEYDTALVEPTCTEQGYTLYFCDCGYEYRDNYVKANGHAEVIVPGVDPTFTSTGLTDGKKCSICDEILIEQEVIPMMREIAIDGEGEVFNYYLLNKLRCSTFIESVEYTTSEQNNGKMELNVNYLVEMVYDGGSSYVAFIVELHNSDGVCISTKRHFSSAEYDTKYLLKDTFYNLEPDDYTLVIKDYK